MGAIVEGGWVGSRVPGGRVAGVGALAKGLVVGVAAGVGASLEADGGTDNGDGARVPGAVVPAKGAGAAEHAATMRTTRVTQEPTAWVRICFTLPFGSGPHPAARVAYRAFDLVDDTRVLARMAGCLGGSAKPTARPCAAATASRARALGCRLCRHPPMAGDSGAVALWGYLFFGGNMLSEQSVAAMTRFGDERYGRGVFNQTTLATGFDVLATGNAGWDPYGYSTELTILPTKGVSISVMTNLAGDPVSLVIPVGQQIAALL